MNFWDIILCPVFVHLNLNSIKNFKKTKTPKTFYQNLGFFQSWFEHVNTLIVLVKCYLLSTIKTQDDVQDTFVYSHDFGLIVHTRQTLNNLQQTDRHRTR